MKRIKFKKLTIIATPLFLLLTFFIGATRTTLADANAPLNIAFIVSGSYTDGGWSENGRNAILAVAKEFGAHVSAVEHVSPIQAVSMMRDYAVSDNYDVVIGHGYEFLTPAQQIAAMGTNTKFIVSGTDQSAPNVMALNFDLSQPSYVLGVLAAQISKTGKLGFIGGEAAPAVTVCYHGFLAGARSVNPNITVAESYTDWNQTALSKSQAEAYIQQGIDVIYQDVDAASQGVFEAVSQADQNPSLHDHPVYVFGSNSNQNDNPTCSQYTLASAVIDMKTAYAHVIKSVMDGTFKPGVVVENSQNGVCIAVLNPKLIGTVITPEMVKSVDAAEAKIQAGKILFSSN
ncbi:MAG TPA: BMP family protein [Phycisphaerae bacterium]|nr:BMP family protein [Phycisphaerae bacterium]